LVDGINTFLGNGREADTGQQGQNERFLGDIHDHEMSLWKLFDAVL